MKTAVRRIALSALTLVAAACAEAPLPTPPTAVNVPSAVVRDTGWMLGRNHEPVEVSYVIRDGWAVFEGDMVLGRADRVPKTREALLDRVETPGNVDLGVIADASSWPNGIVPYTISSSFSASERDTIEAALAWVSSGTWGVSFVPYSSGSYLLSIIPSSAGDCRAHVGRQWMVSNMWLGSGCVTQGVVAHEALHVLRLFHEHSRCDRDLFINVHLYNIKPEWQDDFSAKHCSDAVDFDEYNEGSIMHYPAFHPGVAVNPSLPMITSKRGFPESGMGQRHTIAQTDYNTVNVIYAPRGGAPSQLASGGGTLLSWSRPASTRTVSLTVRYEEYNYYENWTRTHDIGGAFVGNTTSSTLLDASRPRTGSHRCLVWSDLYTEAFEAYYYDITSTYPNWSPWQPTTMRVEAFVAPC